MARHRARRRGLAAAFSSLQAPDQRPYSPLERFYLSVPWIIIVCLGILGNWSLEQIQALIVILIPVILVSVPSGQQA